MASWHSLPFEIKSLILKHYIRDLLYSAGHDQLSKNVNDRSQPSAHVQAGTSGLMSVAAEMRVEIFKIAEGVKEEVIGLLEDEDVKLKELRASIARCRAGRMTPAAIGALALGEPRANAREKRVRETVQVLVTKVLDPVRDEMMRQDEW